MAQVYIDIKKALKKLNKASLLTRKAAEKAVGRAGLYVQAEVKESISGNRPEPRSIDFGLFRASVHTLHQGLKATVASNLPYAKYLEYGTSPHFVSPSAGGTLHWTKGGKDFFSKGHMVSGIRQRRHFRNTARRTKKMVRQMIESSIKTAARTA